MLIETGLTFLNNLFKNKMVHELYIFKSDKKLGKNFKKNLTLNGGKCEYEELSEKKAKRFYGFIFDFEFGEFEFYTFDLSPNYDSNFTESVVYTCDKVDPL